jgi:hypothetical protein
MTAQPTKPKAPKLPPMIIPDDLEIEYVNLVRIAHSPSELVLDLAHLLPGGNPPRVSSRIVMTPVAAKLFAGALVENLKKFEATYGEIKVPGNRSLADYLFKSPGPPKDPHDKG